MSQATLDAMAEFADSRKQWVFGSTASQQFVLPKRSFAEHPDRNYTVKGKIRKYLQHEKQTFGINLGWTDDASPQTAAKVARWFVARPSGGDGPVRYGETIALGNGGSPSFIRYENRRVGVNLGWSEAPVFEWKIGGGKRGEPVRTGQVVALWNDKEEDGLIYFDRDVGGDIGWPTSKTLLDRALQKGEDKLNSLLD